MYILFLNNLKTNDFWYYVLIAILSIWCIAAITLIIAIVIDDWKNRRG
jgi:hypothetical protein